MYCSEIWGNTHKTKLHGIIMLQKRVMRTVYGVDRLEHTNYLFYDSHFLKFPDIVKPAFHGACFIRAAFSRATFGRAC